MDPGNQSRRESNLSGARKFRQLATPTNMIRQVGQSGVQQEQWPVRLSSTNPKDEQMALRQSVVNKEGVVEGLGIATVGAQEFQYIGDKLSDAQETAYKQWVMGNIDLSTPASQEYYFKTLPWIKEAREDEVDRVSSLQKTWAKIAMNGPHSDEDWRMIYAVQEGILEIPNKPVHLLWQDKTGIADTFQKGFFSVFAQQTGANNLPLQTKPSRITWGAPTDATQNKAFEGTQWTNIFPSKPAELFGRSAGMGGIREAPFFAERPPPS